VRRKIPTIALASALLIAMSACIDFNNIYRSAGLTVNAPDSTLIVLDNYTSFGLSGSCQTGSNVQISDDQGILNTTVECTNGSWTASLDFSSHSDGTIVVTVGSSISVTLTRRVEVCLNWDNVSDFAVAGAAGTIGDPFYICNETHFHNITGNDGYFEILNNIEFTAPVTPQNPNATDIVEGNNLTLRGATFSGNSDMGFFWLGGSAVVRNLRIADTTFTHSGAAGDDYTIGVVAHFMGGPSSIENVFVESSVTINTGNNTSGDGVGGVVGHIGGGANTVSNATFEGTIISEFRSNIGGIVGTMDVAGTIEDSTVSGSITGYRNTGGAVGSMTSAGTIRRVTVSGDIDITQASYFDIGGVVGAMNGATIEDCNFSGTITVTPAGQLIGGILGVVTGGGGTIQRSVFSGTLDAPNSDVVGGVVARDNSNSIVIDQVASRGTINCDSFCAGVFPDSQVTMVDVYSTTTLTATGGAAYGIYSEGAAAGCTRCFGGGVVDDGGGTGVTGTPDSTGVTNLFVITGISATDGPATGALTDAQARVLSNFTGFEASGNWKIDTSISPYPVLDFE
jgi:hypothetical protein